MNALSKIICKHCPHSLVCLTLIKPKCVTHKLSMFDERGGLFFCAFIAIGHVSDRTDKYVDMPWSLFDDASEEANNELQEQFRNFKTWREQ